MKKKYLKLLIIGYVWPEPNSSAAGSRMLQLIDFFKREKFEISFCSTARKTDHMVNLEELGVSSYSVKLNDSQFDDFLRELDPEIVLFDRFMMEEQFGWRVDKICPEALKILDTEDLHSLRAARFEAFKKNLSELGFLLDSDLAKREIAAIYRCDLSLIISEAEINILKDVFHMPEKLIQYLPFLISNPLPGETIPKFEERKDFISIGNFLHEPNWNAVLYLKQKIWPKIRRKLPEAKLQIYGAYAGEKVYQLHAPETGFIVNGRADKASVVMRNAKVLIAPIQFGAGLKGKFIEAMQNGTPSVTTTTGAEGINGELDWNGFIVQDDSDFIERAIQLYQNKDVWSTMQEKGFEILRQRFDKRFHEKIFSEKIEKLQDNLKMHRKQNFTGQMLKHHFHKSTYFMSRFIEEKNRNKK